MWFDELGPPWPKHGCFDDDDLALQLRESLTTHSEPAAPAVFGVVIETTIRRPGESGQIVVHCSDGSIVDEDFQTTLDLQELVGQIVMVDRSDEFEIKLIPILHANENDGGIAIA